MHSNSALPFSQACENNRQPIGDVLERHLTHSGSLLEVGSGTGQHAYYFAQRFPHIQWQPSDRSDNIPLVALWVSEAGCQNLTPPWVIDVNQPPEISTRFDFVYSANTLHIMSWQEVEHFFALIPRWLVPGGKLIIYGPFNYEGNFTSASNARFDAWLREQAPHQGIRDAEAVDWLAAKHGLQAVEDVAMPANNRTLVWSLANP